MSVRARGELAIQAGAFCGWSGPGLVLNIGTGIAGAVVRRGKVLRHAYGLGETYGQFGRYLFRDLQTDSWSWRPTRDGSIPPHGNGVIRFTEWCGGPALARRFARLAADKRLPRIAATARDQILANLSFRQLQAEETLLRTVSLAATENASSLAGEFIWSVGTEIGRAVRCMTSSVCEPGFQRLVLTGGVGEKFGAAGHAARDLLLEGIQKELLPGSTVVRSNLGLDAEYIGWAPLSHAMER